MILAWNDYGLQTHNKIGLYSSILLHSLTLVKILVSSKTTITIAQILVYRSQKVKINLISNLSLITAFFMWNVLFIVELDTLRSIPLKYWDHLTWIIIYERAGRE